jgi:multidrug efflux system membrane fusion protein
MLARVHEAEYVEKVNQGRAKLAEGEAALRKASLDLERAKTLFAADSLIKPDLDSAQASFDQAQARVTSAKAEIELALSALRDCALVAPATGVLLERKIEVGALVGVGTVGFVLGDVSAVKARFGIPDAAIGTVKLGETIDVLVDAVAETTFKGRITSLAPTADPQSRVFDVEVTIPNQDGRLRPGMIGTVALGLPPVEERQQPLTVPLSAVIKSDIDADKYALMVVERQGDSDIARLRNVELGEVMGNGVAVTRGVTTGERVIVTGANLLADGDPIRMIP